MKIRALSVFEGVVYHCYAVDTANPCRPTLEVDAITRDGDVDQGPLLVSAADYLRMVGAEAAQACLASRVPYGTPVTLGVLDSVARAESALRLLGFRQLRVRHYGDLARIELDGDELARAIDCREAIVAAVREAGYTYATLDLEGFRSGNLNRSLGAASRAADALSSERP